MPLQGKVVSMALLKDNVPCPVTGEWRGKDLGGAERRESGGSLQNLVYGFFFYFNWPENLY